MVASPAVPAVSVVAVASPGVSTARPGRSSWHPDSTSGSAAASTHADLRRAVPPYIGPVNHRSAAGEGLLRVPAEAAGARGRSGEGSVNRDVGRAGRLGSMTTLSDFSAAAIDGTDTDLSQYDGKVVLVVNTASQCGFTGQYKGLQELHDTYEDQGLVVLGFPCDQFGNQEPGNESEISDFCERNFGVTFPLFSKVEVNGDEAHPLFEWLKDSKGGMLGSKIKWNFTKFLVGRDGQVIDRYAPTTEPEKLSKDIEKAL